MSMDQTDGTAGNNTSSNTISIAPSDQNEEQQAQDTQQMAAAPSDGPAVANGTERAAFSREDPQRTERLWALPRRGLGPN
jgi:hypothetical protein